MKSLGMYKLFYVLSVVLPGLFAIKINVNTATTSSLPAPEALVTPIAVGSESKTALSGSRELGLLGGSNAPTSSEEVRIDNRVVESTIFHTTFWIRCPKVAEIKAMDNDPLHYVQIAGRYRPRLADSPSGGLRAWLHSCRKCRCDEDTGELIPAARPVGFEDPGLAVPDAWSRCIYPDHPTRCAQWIATMLQPEVDSTKTIREYQNALNNIKDGYKLKMPDYEWNPAPRFSMSWNKGPGGYSQHNAAAGETNYEFRQLAPGTKEPYFLEGPIDYGDSLGASQLGRNFGYLGYTKPGSGIFKRESPQEAQHDDHEGHP
ncbi:hypothetical protein TWF730_009274 [Orbilia blumenaviensis]|uniref:Uncharacterized protein n=1 Tax=Orbilia blumenaviensis TaxID=1796055 RepID=A0AAV9UZA8_9PEZI